MTKLAVYLDQNALSDLARDPQWANSDLGRALLAEAVEVFISPVHVLETMQAVEEHVRVALAKVMLTLCGGRRMCPSYEFVVVDYFCRALGDVSPTAVTTREHLDYHRDLGTQIYLGVLCMLAQGFSAAPSAIDKVRRAKLVNQVLHVRAATTPKEWLVELLKCTEEMFTTPDDPLAPLDGLTLDELRGAVAQAGMNAAGVDGDIRQKLQKHRAAIAAAYGAVEIGGCLEAALPLPGELDAAFDANGIALALQKWGVSQKVPAMGEPALSVKAMLQRAIYATAKNGLHPASISKYALHEPRSSSAPFAGITMRG